MNKTIESSFFRKYGAYVWSFAIVVAIGILALCPFRLVNENQLLYLSSTLAQVLAALYGLTVTGYIFFDEKLKTDAQTDSTLIDIVKHLQSQYRSRILVMGVLVLISIAISVTNICFGEKIILCLYVNRIMFLYGILLPFLIIILIITFVFDILNPYKIQEESKKSIKRLEESVVSSRDSLKEATLKQLTIQDFLGLYNPIEKYIIEQTKDILDNSFDYKRPNMANSLKILQRSERFNPELLAQIDKLRKYRNYLIHGQNLEPNEKFYSLAKEVNRRLLDT